MITVKKTMRVEDVRLYSKYAIRVLEIVKRNNKINKLEAMINNNYNLLTEEDVEDFLWLDYKYIFQELGIEVPEEVKEDYITITDILIPIDDNSDTNGYHPRPIIEYEENGIIQEFYTDNIGNVNVGDVYSSFEELCYFLHH